MIKNLLLSTDVYKLSHAMQYPKDTTEIYSYLEARKPNMEMVFFGLQYYLEEYLSRPICKTSYSDLDLFKRTYEKILGPIPYLMYDKVKALCDLGYLPISIKAVPEGTVINTQNILMSIKNTHPDFAWVVGYLESLILKIWNPCTVATYSRKYKKLVQKFANVTCDDNNHIPFQVHDFGYRGVSSEETAQISGAAHLINFLGSDTVPAVAFLNRYYEPKSQDTPIGLSVPACFDDQTEILTDKGFKLFKNLTENDLVAQYNEDKTIDFVKYKTKFAYNYVGDVYKFESLHCDMILTKEHRVVKRSLQTKKLHITEAKDVNFNKRNELIVSGFTNYVGSELSMLERLKIAFQADGSYPSHEEDYNGKRNNGFPIRFQFKKQRKIDRLEYILKQLGIEYSKNKKDKKGYTAFWVVVPEKLDKNFTWIDITKVSKEWCQQFIEECSLWDGSKKKDRIKYNSTLLDNAEKVAQLGIISGFKVNISEYQDKRDNRQKIYTTYLIPNKDSVSGQSIKKTKINYSGMVYCVSVPSGMIIVRRSGKVFISGNSEHSVMCAYGRNNEYEAFDRMLELYPNGIVSIVSDTYDLWKILTDYLPSRKEKILSRDGKVVIRPDCYDKETEILTDSGWKYFENLTDQDLVAQFEWKNKDEVYDDDNGFVHFVKPLKYYSENYDGDMLYFHNQQHHINLMVTPNHRMVKSHKHNIKIEEAKNYTTKGANIHGGQLCNVTSEPLSYEERFKIAYQADGNVNTRIKNQKTTNKQTTTVTFNITEDRKKNRLKTILDNLGYKYHTKVYSHRPERTTFYIECPFFPSKLLNWVNIKNVDGNWCDQFVNEVSNWDAHQQTENLMEYTTKERFNAEIVQTIAVLAGYRTCWQERVDNRKETYSNTFRININYRNTSSSQITNIERVKYVGKVHCVQVPSGMLVVKRKNCITISGNSGHPVKIICGDPEAPINSPEYLGTLKLLEKIFGSTVNSKGYKVLNSKIGAIFGDGMYYERFQEMLQTMADNRFASSNLVIGVGGLLLQNHNRDELGFAIKATRIKRGNEVVEIYKDPITDPGKKSKKGLIGLAKTHTQLGDSIYVTIDQCTEAQEAEGELIEVFRDGKILKRWSIEEVRENVNNA